MGLWGAAQAIAFGAGGFAGTVLVDLARTLSAPSPVAYAFVFGVEALGFFAAHALALNTAFDVPGGAVAGRATRALPRLGAREPYPADPRKV